MSTTTTQTITTTTPAAASEKEKKQKSTSRRPRPTHRKINLPHRARGVLKYKPKRSEQTILNGLRELDPAKPSKTYIDKRTGKERQAPTKPAKGQVEATRIFKSAHLRDVSTYTSVSSPPLATVEKAIHSYMTDADEFRRTKVPEDDSTLAEKLNVEGAVPRQVGNALVNFLSPILGEVNLKLLKSKKSILKLGYLVSGLESLHVFKVCPKLSSMLLRAMDKVPDKFDYKEGTIEIAPGTKIRVFRFFAGNGLDTLLKKTNIGSKNPQIQHALNFIASIFVWVLCQDLAFPVRESFKVTITEQLVNLVLDSSLHVKVYG